VISSLRSSRARKSAYTPRPSPFNMRAMRPDPLRSEDVANLWLLVESAALDAERSVADMDAADPQAAYLLARAKELREKADEVFLRLLRNSGLRPAPSPTPVHLSGSTYAVRASGT
jgi:hypothetical protein